MSIVLSDKEAKENVAANLMRLLGDRGWSMRELSRRSGEDAMTVSTTCRGVTLPNVGTLARLAEALDVSIDRLLMPAGNNSQIVA